MTVPFKKRADGTTSSYLDTQQSSAQRQVKVEVMVTIERHFTDMDPEYSIVLLEGLTERFEQGLAKAETAEKTIMI